MKKLLFVIGLLSCATAQAQSWHWGVQAGLGGGSTSPKVVEQGVRVVSIDGQTTGTFLPLNNGFRYQGSVRPGGHLTVLTRYDWRPRWQLSAGLGLAYQPLIVQESFAPASGYTEYVVVGGSGTDASGQAITRYRPFDRRELNPTTYHYRPLLLELPLMIRYQVGAQWVVEAGGGPRLALSRAVRVDYKGGALTDNGEVVLVEKHRNTTEDQLNTLSWMAGVGVGYRLTERQELGLHAHTTLGSLVDVGNVTRPDSWQQPQPLVPARLRLTTLELQLTHWLH